MKKMLIKKLNIQEKLKKKVWTLLLKSYSMLNYKFKRKSHQKLQVYSKKNQIHKMGSIVQLFSK